MSIQRTSYRLSSSVCALGLSLTSCNPNDFADYAEVAPIRVYAVPSGARRADEYGAVLATLRAEEGASQVSYIIASSGRGSSIVLNRTWNGSALEESEVQRCAKASECAQGAQDLGSVLVPFSVWGRGGADERRKCAFSPANYVTTDERGFELRSPQAWVVCETNKNGQRFDLGLGGSLAEGETLHFSGFGLPPGHPLGVVLFGAHALREKGGGVERRNGGLFRVPDRYESGGDSVVVTPIRLQDPSGGAEAPVFFTDAADRGDLGRELVGAVSGSGELLLAISQPAKRRVIVAAYDDTRPGAVTERLVTRACIDSPDPALLGFGERLALGDVDGDGAPELFVGVDPLAGLEPGKQALYMFRGAGLPSVAAASSVCPAWNEGAVAVNCREQDGLQCAGSAFGASLAVGDVNADSKGDLLVGAPLTQVDGREAGAVWIVPGADGGLGFERAVTIRSPEANARFGTAVAALRTRERDEPVIGAPGANKVFVHMCSALETGFAADSLCLP